MHSGYKGLWIALSLTQRVPLPFFPVLTLIPEVPTYITSDASHLVTPAPGGFAPPGERGKQHSDVP